MRIVKCAIVLGVLTFGANLNLMAQEKLNSTLQEVQDVNSDKIVKELQEAMKNASPEERIKIQKKLDSYLAQKQTNIESSSVGTTVSSDKEQIQQAYFKVQDSEERIEIASSRIKAAEEELNEAEKNKTLTEEELSVRKEKLEKAKKELSEAQTALKKQKEAIDVKRADMVKKGQ